MNHFVFFLLGYYSPDGKKEGCHRCPDRTSTKGTGATSLAQCSGNVTVFNQIFQVNQTSMRLTFLLFRIAALHSNLHYREILFIGNVPHPNKILFHL